MTLRSGAEYLGVTQMFAELSRPFGDQDSFDINSVSWAAKGQAFWTLLQLYHSLCGPSGWVWSLSFQVIWFENTDS
jgi:hypothetical protein